MKNPYQVTAPLLLPTVSVVAGIVAGDCWAVDLRFSLPFAVVLLLASFLFRNHKSLFMPASLLCCLFCGMAMLQMRCRNVAKNYPQKPAVYYGVVSSDAVATKSGVKMDVTNVRDGRKLLCHFRDTSHFACPKLGEGIVFRAVAHSLSTPFTPYSRYLFTHGYAATVQVYPLSWKSCLMKTGQSFSLLRGKLFFLHLRSKLLQRLKAVGMSDDAYAVVAAMALGDRTALTTEIKEAYSLSGASHVLALSGLHLGILFSCLLVLFPLHSNRRRMVGLLLLPLVWCFVFLVGMPASITRSAVMLSLYSIFLIGFRQRASVNVLSFTALAMAAANPLVVFDIGFQLSFLAVLAILLFQPFFNDILPVRWQFRHPVFRWSWSIVSVSLAAQIGTMPLAAFYFGRLSPFFLLTNIIVIPLATLLLHLVLLSFLLGFVPFVQHILFYATAETSLLLNESVAWVAALQGSHTTTECNFNMLQVFSFYILAALLYFLLFHFMGKRVGPVITSP